MAPALLHALVAALLFVAEPAGRWEEEYLGRAIAEHGFDVNRSDQRGKFRYVRAVKVD